MKLSIYNGHTTHILSECTEKEEAFVRQQVTLLAPNAWQDYTEAHFLSCPPSVVLCRDNAGRKEVQRWATTTRAIWAALTALVKGTAIVFAPLDSDTIHQLATQKHLN